MFTDVWFRKNEHSGTGHLAINHLMLISSSFDVILTETDLSTTSGFEIGFQASF